LRLATWQRRGTLEVQVLGIQITDAGDNPQWFDRCPVDVGLDTLLPQFTGV
jgi:hypothetical protein